MTDHKFTDEEIVKALECCNDCNCKECPCYVEDINRCKEIPTDQILDLINRQRADIEWAQNRIIKADKTIIEQKAEIERLTTERDEARRDCADAESAVVRGFAKTLAKLAADNPILSVEAMDTIQTKAIKEFAEIVKTKICEVDHIAVDNLVKEMTGGRNESQNT